MIEPVLPAAQSEICLDLYGPHLTSLAECKRILPVRICEKRHGTETWLANYCCKLLVLLFQTWKTFDHGSTISLLYLARDTPLSRFIELS